MPGTADGASVCANECCCINRSVNKKEAMAFKTLHFRSTHASSRPFPRNLPKRLTENERDTFAESPGKLMHLQESMQFFSHLSADTFGGGDFVHRCSTQAIHRPKPSQQ